jgi:hypothetical protein
MYFLQWDASLIIGKSERRFHMPAKKKDSGRFTDKEDRQAEHIKDSEKKQGKSEEDAERIGYATVNKQKSKKKKSK